ncbi:MAG: tRNA lysidine(34) synthetase TilS, partial [Planctomycetota bacterium]|nr:tRNA lysidine(34) synthetase TilS [Planctomycetota bacterium]
MSRSDSLFAPVSRSVLHALHDAGGRRARLLLALSGGADSTALLRAALDCRSELKLELVAAHLNHRARGDASTADADWLTALCRSLGIPLIHEEIDVPVQAKSAGLGFEEAARTIRYEFLDRTAVAQNCPLLAVAHNADDLAETVLHNLLRGTGIAGMKGIPRERLLPGGTR